MGSFSQPSTSSSQSRGHGQSRNRPRPNLSNQDQLAKLALKTEYMDLLDEINAVGKCSKNRLVNSFVVLGPSVGLGFKVGKATHC